jgi:ParB family transcriptional regulator, chromosome partitioning protein
MSIKDRLAAKAATIGNNPRPPRQPDDVPMRPKTAPGQLMASLPLLAEKEREMQALKERIEQLESGVGDNAAREIDISTLVEKPGRRRVLSPDEYKELRDNLAANPLMQPIVYRPMDDGRNEIISGHNRVSIYRDELKRSTIIGVPFDGSDEEAEFGSVFANLLAPSLPDYEKFRQFQRLQETLGLTRQNIVEASGLNKQHISRIFSFDRLPSAALQLIAAKPHRIAGHTAEKLASIAASGNIEGALKAVRLLIEDEKLTEAAAISSATQSVSKPPAAAVTTINAGKRKFCDISVRNGVVGLKFAGKEGQSIATEWSEKIAEFIRSNLQDS